MPVLKPLSARAAARRPRPVPAGRLFIAAQHFATQSTGNGNVPRHEGTSKVYHKDGTNPNKSYFYIGGTALAVAVAYILMTERPATIAARTIKQDQGKQLKQHPVEDAGETAARQAASGDRRGSRS